MDIVTVVIPEVPEIDFPKFPTLEGAAENDDGTVTVPSSYIVRLAEYKIRIEETEETFREIREASEKQKRLYE